MVCSSVTESKTTTQEVSEISFKVLSFFEHRNEISESSW